MNVSSINYRLGVPGRAAYSATKAGILGLTTGLSRELGREGIRVYLSEVSRASTGHNCVVDGGWLLE